MKLKILKNSKKDYVRKDEKGHNILYPKFKAKTEFEQMKLNFSRYDFHSRCSIEFGDTIFKIPKNRNPYGMDFVASDGSLILLRYKYSGKGEPIIDEIEIIS